MFGERNATQPNLCLLNPNMTKLTISPKLNPTQPNPIPNLTTPMLNTETMSSEKGILRWKETSFIKYLRQRLVRKELVVVSLGTMRNRIRQDTHSSDEKKQAEEQRDEVERVFKGDESTVGIMST